MWVSYISEDIIVLFGEIYYMDKGVLEKMRESFWIDKIINLTN